MHTRSNHNEDKAAKGAVNSVSSSSGLFRLTNKLNAPHRNQILSEDRELGEIARIVHAARVVGQEAMGVVNGLVFCMFLIQSRRWIESPRLQPSQQFRDHALYISGPRRHSPLEIAVACRCIITAVAQHCRCTHVFDGIPDSTCLPPCPRNKSPHSV